MKIQDQLLPYNDHLELRDTRTLQMIVLHCTELSDLKEARQYGERILYEDNGTGNSGHFYIDRDGTVYRYVMEDRIAHHVVGHNRNSIGIEIVNRGRYPDWYAVASQTPTEDYTPEQMECVRELLRDLKARYPSLTQIARHSDLDVQMIAASDDPSAFVRRKIDPGPRFPWDEIVACWEKFNTKTRSHEDSG